MNETLTIWVGEGSSLDGGPFVAARIIDVGEGTFTVEDDSIEGTHEYPQESVTELAGVMENNEPASIGTVPREDGFHHFTVPVRRGFVYETGEYIATGEELAHAPELCRQVSDSFRKHGGSVQPDY